MAGAGFAYISVIDWPSGFTRDDMVRAVSLATGMDPFLAGQRIAKSVPMVLMRLPQPAADSAMQEFRKAGVTVFAPSDEQLGAVPAPVRAKRLQAAAGSDEPMYLCEPWRGEAFGLKPRDIFLIVRARIGKAEHAGTRTEVDFNFNYMARAPSVTTHEVSVERTSITDLMDLYLRPRAGSVGGQMESLTRVRIDGRKFNFDVLGERRGYSDNVNADNVALLIAQQAPRAIIDTRFGDFTCPPGTVKFTAARFSADSRQRRDDHPLFEFYSAWSCLLYLGLMGS